MNRKNRTSSNRIIRHYRIRKTVAGSSERPRLSVFRSHKHLEAQIVDDFEQKTLISATTKSKEFEKIDSFKEEKGKVGEAMRLGRWLAEKAKQKNITQVVFDRSGYLYHGRVKAFADAARHGGLSF